MSHACLRTACVASCFAYRPPVCERILTYSRLDPHSPLLACANRQCVSQSSHDGPGPFIPSPATHADRRRVSQSSHTDRQTSSFITPHPACRHCVSGSSHDAPGPSMPSPVTHANRHRVSQSSHSDRQTIGAAVRDAFRPPLCERILAQRPSGPSSRPILAVRPAVM